MADIPIIDPTKKSAEELAIERTANVVENLYSNSIKKATDLITKQKLELEDVENVIKKYPNDIAKANEELRIMIEEAQSVNLAFSTGGTIIDNFAKHLGVAKEANIALSLATGQWAKALSEAAIYGAQTLTDWYEHTAKVNRQLYDIQGSLGNLGKASYDFENAITDVSSRFKEMPDDVRKTVHGMAEIGMASSEIKEHLSDIYVLSKQWSDITPEKQIQTMSMYIKEFGMNGDKAWATMFSLYNISQDLKKDLPNLDIKKFVDQTNEVSVSMRKYGLEASDAIALTSTLVKLGVEQARVGEIAKTMAGVGMESPATVAYMTQRQLMPGMRRERTGLVEQFEEGKGTLESAQRIQEIEKRLSIGERSMAGQLGLFFTAKPEEKISTQMGLFEEMIKVGTGGRGLGKAAPEELIGALSQLKLPGIGQMAPETVKEFAEAVQKGGITPENIKKAFSEAVKKQEDAADIVKKQETKAMEAADATTTMQKDVAIIKALLGQVAQKTVYGETIMKETATSDIKEFLKTQGRLPTEKEQLGMGIIGALPKGEVTTLQQNYEQERHEKVKEVKEIFEKSTRIKGLAGTTEGLAEYHKSLEKDGMTKEEQKQWDSVVSAFGNEITSRFAKIGEQRELSIGFDASLGTVTIMDKNTKKVYDTHNI